ncbi:Ammonium transporter NrgA [compost metagenome]
MLIVIVFSFVVSFVIFKIINLIQPIRVSSEEEEEGLDASQHNEKYFQGTLIVASTGMEIEHEPTT